MTEQPKRHESFFAKAISREEILERVFITDQFGNVFSVPSGDECNAQIEAGLVPTGFEVVYKGDAINPKYRHLLAASLTLFQMVEAAKTVASAHGEDLVAIDDETCGKLGAIFDKLASSLNLAQRQALEGLQSLVDNSHK